MALRTTSLAVQGILLSDYGPKTDGTLPSLTPFIEMANAMVSGVVTCAGLKGQTLSTVSTELMERWLAAHFYVMSDQPYEEKTTGRSKGIYQGKGKLGEGLKMSKYGQSAMLLDSSRCLGKVSASMAWLGKNPPTQTAYINRA